MRKPAFDVPLLTVNIRGRVRGWSCEPNNQLNVCTTSVTEGEVGPVKLV